MSSILEKRNSLHKRIVDEEKLRNELESQIDSLQSLANIGMVTAMIAHEMNNILTPLGNYAQLALNHPEDVELKDKAIRKTAKNTARASKILASVLSMSRGSTQGKKLCPLQQIIDDIFSCMARDFAKDGITVIMEIPNSFEVFADSISFQQVIMNLIINARQSMLGTGGRLTISAQQTAEGAVIEIADTGSGIEASILEKIFDPFFTTKADEPDSHGGNGLGLAFSARIVESHGGSITVQSSLGQGTSFQVTIPAA